MAPQSQDRTPGSATPRDPSLATNYRESGLVVCPACSVAWGWKSPIQPDGGEGLAKRKGGIARWRSIKGQGCRSGRRAGKATELTWGGLRHVPISELRAPRGGLTVAQESA